MNPVPLKYDGKKAKNYLSAFNDKEALLTEPDVIGESNYYNVRLGTAITIGIDKP